VLLTEFDPTPRAADLVVALAQLLPQRGVGRAVGKGAPGDERVDVKPVPPSTSI